MRGVTLVVIGIVMAGLGLLWTLQGLGRVGGSPMTGVAFWATVGPIVAGLGVALVIVAVTRRKH